MVKIAHYEVYTDRGDGWRLEDRFSADQRYEAVSLAKEREQARIKVKIIKENFDVQDNTYQETVEYISTPKIPSTTGKSARGGYSGSNNGGGYVEDMEEEAPRLEQHGGFHAPGAGAALLKLVSIIVVSLVLVNLFVCFVLGKRWLQDNPFETGVGLFGMACGVLATGLMLVKVMDPDNETTASTCISTSSTLGYAWQIPYMVVGSLMIFTAPTITTIVTVVLFFFFLIVGELLFGRKKKTAG